MALMRIFVSQATSLMNICGLYSSMMWLYRRTYTGRAYVTQHVYVHWLTNEQTQIQKPHVFFFFLPLSFISLSPSLSFLSLLLLLSAAFATLQCHHAVRPAMPLSPSPDATDPATNALSLPLPGAVLRFSPSRHRPT
jgi:hypothetical protein